MMIETEEQSVVIIMKQMVGLRGMDNSWGVLLCFLIVIWFTLTLYDLYAIVVKDRVYVVDKMNVECWGLLLTLIKYKFNR